MNMDKALFRLAGTMILVSVALSYFHTPYWQWLTVFIGLNLLQSSFTGWCPAVVVFRKLGVKSGCAFKD